MENIERKQKKHRNHEEDTPARKKENGSSQKEDHTPLQKKKKKKKLIKEPVEEISTPIAGSSAKNRSQKHAEGTPLRRENLTKEHKSSQEEEDTTMQTKKKKKLIREPIVESSTPIEESSAQRHDKRERLRKEKITELIAVNKEKENKKKKKSSELIAVNKEKESKKKKKRKKILKEDLDSSFSGKRRRLEEDPQADVRENRQAMSVDVLFLLLVPSKDLGKVIGQHGSRVQELREKTGAQIKIGDAIMNLEERIIWISSKEDSSESQSAAERALLHVATLLVTPENEGQEIAKIRLLIAGSQAGSVVGKAGVAINELQKNTGAVVRVLTKDKFPLLAFSSETDRLVQLEGEVSQVLKALELIAVRLRKSPRYSKSVKGRKGLMLKKGGAFEASVQIRIPNDLRGNVIGKGGANISQITQQCGAVSIQVDRSKDDAQETTIHLKGTLSQVTMAQALLQVFLASKQRTE